MNGGSDFTERYGYALTVVGVNVLIIFYVF